MNDSNTSGATTNPCAAAERLAAVQARHEGRLSLTRGQRLLAGATAAAVLVSGINALVQITRVLVQCWLPHG